MDLRALKARSEEVNMLYWIASICTAFGLIVAGAANAAPGQNWPEVQPFHKTFHFDDVDKAGFDITLKGSGGEALYSLSCHSGSFDEDSEFNYSGLLACRLASLYSKEKVSTLLTETPNQSSDWENRGRFLVKHILPGCAEYPEWGRTRNFYLRDMKLTLSIKGEDFIQSSTGEDVLKSYSIDVTVQRDPLATTPLAHITNVSQPPWFYGVEQCPKTK